MLKSRRWAAIRRQVLDAAGWRCERCGKAGRLEADHVIPLHMGGGEYDISNLQALCRRCHLSKTRRERRADDPPEVQAWRQLVDELSTDGRTP